jgi:hypothetical protein
MDAGSLRARSPVEFRTLGVALADLGRDGAHGSGSDNGALDESPDSPTTANSALDGPTHSPTTPPTARSTGLLIV